MAERFVKLYVLPLNLYRTGAPVLIAAGQLLRDTVSGAAVGQLKLVNISDKPVSSVTALFEAFGPDGLPAGGPFTYTYTDLRCGRDRFCASRTAVKCPDAAAHSFTASVTEVIFADGSIWTAVSDAAWEPLEVPKARTPFRNPYAEKVYERRFSGATQYLPAEEKDLWYCGCGALNRAEEPLCHTCRKELSAFYVHESELAREGMYAEALKLLASGNKLTVSQAGELFFGVGAYKDAPQKAKEAADKIVALEKIEEESAVIREKNRKEAKLKAARARKKRRIITFLLVLLLALGAVYYFVFRDLLAYNKATGLMEAERYEEAKAAFTVLGPYKDSAELITECDYRAAGKLFTEGRYEEAEAAYAALGLYGDSAARVDACRSAMNNRDYDAAAALYAEGRYEEAMAGFRSLGNFEDSAAQVENCREAIRDRDYAVARSLMDEGRYAEAKNGFGLLNGYKDSAVMIKECDYQTAAGLYEKAQYEEAKTAYTALGNYKDSPVQAEKCREATRGRNYEAAEALLESGQYAEAKAAFTALGEYNDSAEMIKECDYRAAKALYDAGDYEGAAAEFSKLQGYKDADELLASDANLKDAVWSVGSTVLFGTYPQTASGNDQTPIEWLVLARSGNKAMIISRYALECRPYHTKNTNVTWEKSSMRKWLNGDFYSKAFSKAEKKAVQVTAVDNGVAQRAANTAKAGPDTKDRVFLLSYAESERYFSDAAARRCVPTDYALGQHPLLSGSVEPNGREGCSWWLRSPGKKQSEAAEVFDGDPMNSMPVHTAGGAVRPVLWVDITLVP